MKIISAASARANFQDIINEVYYSNEEIIISKNGKPRVLVTTIPDTKEARSAIAAYQNEKKKK